MESPKNDVRKPRSFREWIDSFIFASIFFLILTTFLLGTFQIPSSSMEPTLVGGDRDRDRILVDRLSHRFDPLRRWDVVVFRYPMNRSRYFVKRIVGMPGEEIRIRRGDIYANGTLVSKSSRVQEAFWLPVYPPSWSKEGADQFWEGGEFETDSLQALSIRRGESIRYIHPAGVTSDYWKEGESKVLDPVPVSDLRVGFLFLARGDGTLWLQLEDVLDGPSVRERPQRMKKRVRLELPVGVGEGELTVQYEDEMKILRKKVDGQLGAGQKVSVQLEQCDGIVRVHVKGVLAAEILLDRSYEGAYRWTEDVQISFGLNGCEGRVERLAIDRDIHYTGIGLLAENRVLSVPHGRFLVLGDNSPNSQDSRKWQIRRFRYLDSKGRFLAVVDKEVGNPMNPVRRVQSGGEESIHFYDVNGVMRSLSVSRLENPEGARIPSDLDLPTELREGLVSRSKYRHQGWEIPYIVTVPRENIVGRAFWTYFPLFRMKILR
ncbi:MAG: signal peptidase I [Planctomycetota bacterium]|nr:signal peptidase I [Planctomycetota bacterium]